MKKLNYVRGKIGEKLAVEYLKRNKYKILEINYANSIGEIDIIAKQHKTIVFVEVKFRNSANFGLPIESVTAGKQNKIKGVALLYLKEKSLTEEPVRFDVISILGEEISHIKNAF